MVTELNRTQSGVKRQLLQSLRWMAGVFQETFFAYTVLTNMGNLSVRAYHGASRWISFNAAPRSEAWFCSELWLIWGAHTHSGKWQCLEFKPKFGVISPSYPANRRRPCFSTNALVFDSRIFKARKRYRDVLGTLFILADRLGSLVATLVLLYYFYAIIGMECFGQIDMTDCCKWVYFPSHSDDK